MSPTRFLVVWGTVICLTGVAVGLLPRSRPVERSDSLDSFAKETLIDSPVVVIGSSLMMYAVPPVSSRADSLLGDGRPHLRLALSRITEKETLSILNQVLSSHVECVFVEVQPLCIDFRFQMSGQGALGRTVLHDAVDDLRTFSRDSKRELGRITGWRQSTDQPPHKTESMTDEPSILDEEFHVAIESLGMFYPLRLRPPRELKSLKELINRARNQHTRIVLVAPPRSQTAIDYIGTESAISLEKHIRDLAQELQLPVFLPARAWPDEFFIDQAHMNRRGRTRFCAELARWSSTRP